MLTMFLVAMCVRQKKKSPHSKWKPEAEPADIELVEGAHREGFSNAIYSSNPGKCVCMCVCVSVCVYVCV